MEGEDEALWSSALSCDRAAREVALAFDALAVAHHDSERIGTFTCRVSPLICAEAKTFRDSRKENSTTVRPI
jgi:hypothetical protein